MPVSLRLLAAATAAATSLSLADEASVDPQSGLLMTGDWALVRAHCTVCHSGGLVTRQRGTAAQWLGMIRWMQDTQNLWAFDADTERRIVAYLAEQYAPGESRRRAPLPPALLPPNPYTAAGGNEDGP